MEKKRIEWIDVAKGIAILAVVLGHVGHDLTNRIVYPFHLTVFYILTGYTFKVVPLTKAYVRDKFQRLMIPFFIAATAVPLGLIVKDLIVLQKFTVASVTKILSDALIKLFFASGSLNNLVPIKNMRLGAIWFLPAMFLAIILLQYILNVVKVRQQQWFVVVGLAVVATMSATIIWLPFSIQSALYSLPFIMIGVEAKERQLFTTGLQKQWLSFGIIALLISVISKKGSIYFASANAQDVFLSPVLGVMVSFGVIAVAQRLEKVEYLSYLGKNSLTLLCIHLFDLQVLTPLSRRFLAAIGIKGNPMVLFAMMVVNVLTMCLLFHGLTWLKQQFPKKVSTRRRLMQVSTQRDITIDVLKGFLIVLMLIGHLSIDKNLRHIIYSFHMPAFIIFSGYFFKEETVTRFSEQLMKMAKSFLIPYGVGAALVWVTNIKRNPLDFVVGMSFAKKYLTQFQSVGPIYFVLLLLLLRVIYLSIAKWVPNLWQRTLVVIGVSYVGVLLGQKGFWLPWSLDVALYALIFYHIGYLLKRHKVLQKLSDMPYAYFVLVLGVAWSLQRNTLELATRKYGQYSLAIIGALCATCLAYLLIQAATKANVWGVKGLLLIGKHSVWVLVAHVVFKKEWFTFLLNAVPKRMELLPVLILVVLQIVVGICVGQMLNKVMSQQVKKGI